MSYVSVKNVVCTCDFGVTLDLDTLAAALGGRLDKKVFPALMVRCRETNVACSLFVTGRAVLVGGQSEAEGLETAERLARALWRFAGVDCRPYNFTVSNLVCRVKLPFELDLDLLYADAKTMPITVQVDRRGRGGPSYEPEVFPGLAWPTRVGDATITFALFSSGGGVATGLRSSQHVHIANTIMHDMYKYQKGNTYRDLLPTERHSSHPPPPPPPGDSAAP